MSTERDMLDALAARYTERAGNGERWVVAEHVRNGTGFYGWSDEYQRCTTTVRTADFIAVDGWESKGHAIHGHEVKVSRSDWLTELRDPEKSAQWMGWCDYWWLVVADASIVREGELPRGWGLIVYTGKRLVARKQAPRRRPSPLPLPVQISLMRSVGKTTARRMWRAWHAEHPAPAPDEYAQDGLALFEVSS